MKQRSITIIRIFLSAILYEKFDFENFLFLLTAIIKLSAIMV